jgi:hypothetical protein
MSFVWFVLGAAAGIVLVELAATLFYCLPKAAHRLLKGTASKGLLLLFLRTAAYRCIALLLLWFCIAHWSLGHDRALAWGASIVLSAYLVHTFAKEGRKGLAISFDRQAVRYTIYK